MIFYIQQDGEKERRQVEEGAVMALLNYIFADIEKALRLLTERGAIRIYKATITTEGTYVH